MKINYTRKSSGYIAVGLSLVTIKVFFEALLLGRGPIPGLSFLLYTIIFYIHYALEDIEKFSLIGYNQFIDLYNALKAYNWAELVSETQRNYLKNQFSKFSNQIENSVRFINSKIYSFIALFRSKILRFQTGRSPQESPLFLKANTIWVDVKNYVNDDMIEVIALGRNVYNWMRAISNVLIRKTQYILRSLAHIWTTFSDEIVTKKMIESSDDTT